MNAALVPLSDSFPATRLAMHRVAAYVVSPARRHAMGRMGLRAAPGGFSPTYSGPEGMTTVGVEGTDIVTHSDAADAGWFGLGWGVLEALSMDDASKHASDPQLWPKHVDPAIEIGDPDGRSRASYGFSPGDVSQDAAALPLRRAVVPRRQARQRVLVGGNDGRPPVRRSPHRARSGGRGPVLPPRRSVPARRTRELAPTQGQTRVRSGTRGSPSRTARRHSTRGGRCRGRGCRQPL